MWAVVRATTAAPRYLAPIRIRKGDEAEEYLDGGFGINDPSVAGCFSVREASGRNPISVLSVGSGTSQSFKMRSGGGLSRFMDDLRIAMKVPSNIDNAHLIMMDLKTSGGVDDYYRLNVQEGLSEMAVDEWKGKHGKETLRMIRERTEEYLRLPSVKDDIAKAARILVETRRARASTDHWERFCNGVEYVCIVTSCKERGNVYRERGDLRRHLEDAHHIDSSTIETVLDQGRRHQF